ncbi:UvrD-helicase domain-containing protein [Candidatus Peregrinibacteria bacterium]|nr:UvrD-helicase domain-containing protein [Candidatus Peregrinibacteria bacterium]
MNLNHKQTSSPILASLNDKQREAVTHFAGPLIIIAGAGSGKTRALTHRVANLITDHNVNPADILAVTFTNKAANEMKDRITKLLVKAEIHGEPTVGTFHSTCVRILRKNIHLLDYENSFTIYDVADQQILMKRIMEDLRIDNKQINPKALLAHISMAKNELVDWEKYRSMTSNYFTERVAEVYRPYQEALKKANALDFDDLLMKTVELFREYPETLDYYQEKFKFINIDEYQDTNHAQYVIVKMLAEKYRNICVIGDTDQSIYSWRGADIRNILEFEKDYPEAKIVKMEQNYRSTQTILDAAHGIIIKNRKRVEKKLWTRKKGGEKINVYRAINERHEGEYIAEKIRFFTRDEESPVYNNFVVLYRTNAQSRAIEEVFLRYGLPYKIVGGIRFYERKEVKDMVAYLRVIHNPNDIVSMLRIINTPPRKIGTKTIEALQAFASRHNISLFEAMQRAENIDELNDGQAKHLKDFAEIILKLQKANSEFTASGVIKHVMKAAGYKEFLDDGTPEGEARYENISELISVASKYDSLEPKMSLAIFLEEISLIADVDSLDEKDNAVILMTVHSAKGLEFDTVFIAGLEEGIFPHSRSMLEPDEMEEERRLMYVAVTRAKNNLYILYTRERMLYGEYQSNAPSQFIADIPQDLVLLPESTRPNRGMYGDGGFADARAHSSIGTIGSIGGKPIPVEEISPHVKVRDGDKVMHTTFGEGVVVSVQGDVATVAFKDPNAGIKRLALSIAPLIKMD